MMSPTLILKEGQVRAGLGSAGSNRIRSAVLQTTLNLLSGVEPQSAVDAPRIHLEGDVLQAEPGVDEQALKKIELAGREVFRWNERNLFFGGVQIVTRDPETVGFSDPLAVALAKMDLGGYRHLPVLDHEKPVGMVSMRDVLKHVMKLCQDFES